MEDEEIITPDIQIVDHDETGDTDIKEGVPSQDGAPSIQIVDSGFDVSTDNIYEGLDTEDYTDYLGDDIFVPTAGIEGLNSQRAENQPWYEQLGSAVGQAVVGEIVGGTVEGLGYLLDFQSYANLAKGQETEWGNWLSDVGKGLREGSQEYMPIYEADPGSFNMSDSGWWYSNSVSVASTLSMLIPASGATRALSFLGKGLSKGAGVINKSMDIASKMSMSQKWMANGITQAVVSRHIENSMEASGTFESSKEKYLNTIDPATGVAFTDDKATQLAADAASENYQKGWLLLMQDIPQYLAIGKVFNPRTMRMESALSKAAKKGKNIKLKQWQRKGIGLAGTGVSEGLEESYQYIIAERGKLLSDLKAGLITEEEYTEELKDKFGDDEMKTAGFWGALGGAVFQTAGPGVNQVLKSKETKAFEKGYAERQHNFTTQRGQAYQMMQKELANADLMEDPDKRKTVINEMMTQMTVEAIELERFDNHIENLQALTSSTPEQLQEIANGTGAELNAELFKKYIPEIIESAHEIRKDYFKILNKGVKSPTALALARNKKYKKDFRKKLKDISKEVDSMKTEIVGYNEVSDKLRRGGEVDRSIKALQAVNAAFERKAEKANPTKTKQLRQVIKENEAVIQQHQKTQEELDEIEKTSDQILADKKYKSYFTDTNDLLSKEVEKATLESALSMFEKENLYLKSDQHKRDLKEQQLNRHVNEIQSTDDVDGAIENINNSDISAEEKKDYLKRIEKRRDELIKSEADAKRAKNKANHDTSIADKAENNRNESPTTLPADNIAKSEGIAEDPYHAEESPITAPLDKSDAATEHAAKGSHLIKLLDAVGSDNYMEWLTNGKSKIGTEVTYELGDPVNQYAKKALAEFNSGKITDSTYKNLPIKAVIGDKANDIYTFLPGFTKNNEFFETNELPQRKILIDRMLQGETKTTIQYATGGDLILDDTVDGPEVNNSLLDLYEYKGKNSSDLDILLTDDLGQLINKKKELSVDHKGTVLTVKGVNTEKGNPIPYKGGVFLNVSRADGSKFPMRLNLARNTRVEAETVADLLIEVGVKKTITMDQPLSTLDPELRKRLKANHPNELKVLGKDPKAIDIINMFVYVSDQTKGLASELYLSGVWVKFAGGKIDVESQADAGAREKLVDFIQNTKRRQFNLNSWNENPKYRDYMVTNKVISTNGTVNAPLFQSTPQRKIAVYAKRLDALPAKEEVVKSGIKTTGNADFDARVAKSKKVGIKKDEFNDNKLTGYYFGKFGALLIDGASKAEIQAKIDAKYQAEGVTVKESTPKLDKTPKKVVSSQKKVKKKIGNPFDGSNDIIKKASTGPIKKDCK